MTYNFKELKFLPPHAQEKKISLNLKQMVIPPTPPPKPKPRVVPSVPQPVVKPVIKKKIVEKPVTQPIKKKILDDSKKNFAVKSTEDNNVTKVVKKEIKNKPVKKIVKKKPVKKKVTKKRVVKKKPVRKKPKRSKDALANFLRGSTESFKYTKSPKRQRRRPARSGSYGERMIKNLYGGEFKSYSPTQKKFIRNNLGTIHRITQRTLTRNGYPTVAVQTMQQGTNVVSFYLHPNGDISKLRLKTPIGYRALDQNTLEVIRIAYKDYPLPNQKTRIVFYVQYSIY